MTKKCLNDSQQRKRVRHDTRPIWQVAEELGRSIPQEDWAKVPTDGAKNLDHYLYGHARKVE